MNELVILSSNMDSENNNITLSYSIPVINVSGKYTCSQDEYLSAMQSNGFDGVKSLIVNYLLSNLNYFTTVISKPSDVEVDETTVKAD